MNSIIKLKSWMALTNQNKIIQNPVQVSKPNPVQVSQSNPVQVSKPNPVQVSKPNPVQVSKPNPVQVSKSNLVQVSQSNLVQVSQSNLVQNQDQNELSDIDEKFCQIYYQTTNLNLIKQLISSDGIKNMTTLNNALPSDFSKSNYEKYCENITNPILIKKKYLEFLKEKKNIEQIINIIIIKQNKINLDTIIPIISNPTITISLISDFNESIEHPNIKKYKTNNNHLQILNKVINSNTSKYYCIINDNFRLDKNFINKLLKELTIINTKILLLILDDLIQNYDSKRLGDYFNIQNKYLKSIIEPYISIFNNEIKTEYRYSINNIGQILYTNELAQKCEYLLALTTIEFNINSNINSNIKDMLNMFDLYIENQNDNIINNYDKEQKLDVQDNNDIIETKLNEIYINQLYNNQYKYFTDDQIKSLINLSILPTQSEQIYQTNHQDQNESLKLEDQSQSRQSKILESSKLVNLPNDHTKDHKIEFDFLLMENSNLIN